MVGANVQFDVDGRWNAHGQKTADRVESNFFQDGQKSSSLESGAFQVVRWFQQVDFNKQEDRQEDHNGSIGNTTNTCWNQISESRRWTMASCYLQLLPAFSFHISSPNQSPHAPGITAWIFPYPEVVKFNWLKVVYYRFMMAIGAQRKILKTPQLLNGSEKLESLEFADNFWVGPWRNQTNTNRSEGRIFKAFPVLPVKWLAKWDKMSVSDLPHIYLFMVWEGFLACLVPPSLHANSIPCYWPFRYLGNDAAGDLHKNWRILALGGDIGLASLIKHRLYWHDAGPKRRNTTRDPRFCHRMMMTLVTLMLHLWTTPSWNWMSHLFATCFKISSNVFQPSCPTRYWCQAS